MHHCPLSYQLARARQRELLDQVERSRRSQAAMRRVAAAAVAPRPVRRRALRRALLEACGLAATERP
jgi:hypothetical protein